MIVTCKQCATQFQLADAKVPAGGVRVRCSRCKHAFFIEPAGAAPPLEPVHRAAQAALDAEDPPEPAATEDLPEGGGELASDFEDENDISDESDWEFNQTPLGADEPTPTSDAARAAIDDLLGARPTPRREPSPGPSLRRKEPASVADGSEQGELGSPEDWDFLAGEASSAATPSGAAAADLAPGPPRESGRTTLASASPPRIEEWIEPTEPSRVLAWIARTGNAAGWSVTALLFALAAVATLAPAFSGDTGARLGTQRLGTLVAQGVSGRWVENAVAGPLFVVSGRLANPSGIPTVLGEIAGVRLLDGNGARLGGEPALVGPVIPQRDLREIDPGALQARQAEGGRVLAARLIPPGDAIPFEAVVIAVPPAASRFVLEPLPHRREAPVEETSEAR